MRRRPSRRATRETMPAREEDFELRGPLQAEVMAALWKLGEATVYDVRSRQRGAKRKSYTTSRPCSTGSGSEASWTASGAASPTCTAPSTSSPNCWRAASGDGWPTHPPRAVARRSSVWSSHSQRTTWTTSSDTYESSETPAHGGPWRPLNPRRAWQVSAPDQVAGPSSRRGTLIRLGCAGAGPPASASLLELRHGQTCAAALPSGSLSVRALTYADRMRISERRRAPDRCDRGSWRR